MTEKDTPRFTDPLSGEPVVHPAGAYETRPTEPGEIGYSADEVSVTALTKDVKEKKIGDTDRVAGPAVIGNPDQTIGVETQKSQSEQESLPEDVLYERSNGDIVKAKATRVPDSYKSDVAYIVVYEVQGQTMRRTFKEGELEAMQEEIAKKLADGDTLTQVDTDEGKPDQGDSNGIITHVPGMPPYDGHLPSREVETIPLEDYKGDPTRVMGHPSNPTSQIMQAYSDQLRAPLDPSLDDGDGQE